MTQISGTEANWLLDDLTPKQVEVLDLLVQHRTTKQIARELGIAPNTVDQRILGVREKWGTADRNATARVYQQLLRTCEEAPCGFSPVDRALPIKQDLFRELPRSPLFKVSDVADLGPLFEERSEPVVLEVLDARFGKVGRLAAIVVLAFVLALTVIASLAIAQGLARIM